MAGAGLDTSRRLLRRVRDIMAGPASAQERLDQLVRTIATVLSADVCSVYVLRAGDILELFATEGLKREAVHVTRLRIGEGIIGDIAAHAKPLAMVSAPSHPAYAYRPETGEEKFNAMLGVPILRGGNVIGVLAVQHVEHGEYTEEESETLQTVAMVLAELVVSIGLGEAKNLPLRLEGMGINGGLASGRAVLHDPRIVIRQPVAEDPDAEMEILSRAMIGMSRALDDLFSSSGLDRGETGDILKTYRMFAEDQGWMRRIREAVESGLTAEAAVFKVQEDTRARMSQIADPYLRERLHDFEDLSNRLLRHLSGNFPKAERKRLPDNIVLVARSMGPAELLDYDPNRLRALVLEEGSQTCHVAIIARDMDIPVLGRVKDALGKIAPLEQVIVDADNEQVIVRPAENTVREFKNNMRERAKRRAVYDSIRDLPAETLDGTRISLNINAGLLADLPQMHSSGADGIGLYRTEIPFMVYSTFPNVEEQTKLYKKVLDQAKGRPVVFRTLDIGGDKTLPYMRMDGEGNPAMGWRSIRIGLDRPSMLRQQLRAMIRAAAGRRLEITFPMISEVSEFDTARAYLELELDRARARGEKLPKKILVGTMLEVPILAWQLPALRGRVDFISVGSNDLFQFLFASDRGNPRITGRYDLLSPPVLSYLRWIVERCDDLGIPVSVCGAMAGKPLEAMTLIGLGYRNLSMAPSAIGPVKFMTLTLDGGQLREYLDVLYRLPDRSVRNKLRFFAKDHGIAV